MSRPRHSSPSASRSELRSRSEFGLASTLTSTRTTTKPFAGGEDSGYFIWESSGEKRRSRFDSCLERGGSLVPSPQRSRSLPLSPVPRRFFTNPHQRRCDNMKLNILKLAHLARPRTHEGAPAAILTPEHALRRSVLACMLWENEFYEDGVAIAGRIRELVPKVEASKVAALAVEARIVMKLRHAPLLLVREMARHALVAETMASVIQRADEL